MRYVVASSVASSHGEKPACGQWSDWPRDESLPMVTTVEGRDAKTNQLLIVVRYHHKRALSPTTVLDGTLRHAMASLLSLKAAFDVKVPGVVRVDHWAYTDPRRLPPVRGQPVGPENVNGGCTMGGGGEVITCYRQEEYPKVWLHEAVHCFRLDFGAEAPTRALPIRTEKPVLVNEAWTELLAEAFAVAFTTGANVGTRRWQAAWRLEVAHALDASARLLRHNGYSRAEQLFDGSRTWRERTNVLAYYVLRAALMPRPDEWMAVTRFSELMALLRQRLASPDFRTGLQRALDAAPSNNVRSLRMMSSTK